MPLRVRRLKQGLAVAMVASSTMLGAAPAQAAGSPIRECGAYGWTARGDGPRFMRDDEIAGAGVYNITTRVATCARARQIVRRFWQHYDEYCGNVEVCAIGWGFVCRTRSIGEEFGDTRCTASRGRVVRFQSGA